MALLSEEGYEIERIGQEEEELSKKVAEEFVEKKPSAKVDNSEAEDNDSDRTRDEKEDMKVQ